jgi:hypothetical protein
MCLAIQQEKWSPKHLFRPYNYHLLSYYKKFLMIVSVPMFYGYPAPSMAVLTVLQLVEMARLCATWPYVSRCRNLYKLALEFILLLFFITGLIQCIALTEIQKNDSATL